MSARLSCPGMKLCSYRIPSLQMVWPHWGFPLRSIRSGTVLVRSMFPICVSRFEPSLQDQSFYVNPPGLSVDDACSWGSNASPWGNWAPYVLSVNRREQQRDVFLSISWNPVYLEDATPFRDQKPSFGIRVTCPDGTCESQCSIDPRTHASNQMGGGGVLPGGFSAKGPAANFCQTQVPQGGHAEVVLFPV